MFEQQRTFWGGILFFDEVSVNFNVQTSARKVDKTRDMLAAKLEPGETLFEYCQGTYSASALSKLRYLIGLTDRRLVILNQGGGRKFFSIPRELIASIRVDPSYKNTRKPALLIDWRGLAPDQAQKASPAFAVTSSGCAQANNLCGLFQQMSAGWQASAQALNIPAFLQLVTTLQTMGFDREGQSLLSIRCAADPYLQSSAEAQQMLTQISETKLAMRIAAVIFLLVIAFLLYLAVQGQATVGFGIILAIIAVIDLLRGNPAGRSGALALAVLTVLLNVVLNLIDFSPLDVLVWACFGLAMLLLLTGKPGPFRIALGGAVFAVGSVGVLAFVFLGAAFFPKQLQAIVPAAPDKQFVEDFSKDNGWIQINDDNHQSKLENSAYAMTIKKPGMSYFSFPPVAYLPVKAEVDAQIANLDTSGKNAFFGLVCDYQRDADKYYLVYVDPIKNRYLVEQMIGDDEQVLTDSWQTASGMKSAAQSNRIGMTCANNQITVTVNGVQQPAIQVPGMAQFGSGKMGLMTAESASSNSEIKVVFDNAAFWPAEK
jgi:hypothetical protein